MLAHPLNFPPLRPLESFLRHRLTGPAHSALSYTRLSGPKRVKVSLTILGKEVTMISVDSVTAPDPDAGCITEALSRVRTGEREAWNALLHLVYADLHRLAQAYMREHPPD